MQEESMRQKEFGLGQIPLDATNELLLDPSFTREDFEEVLKNLFPLSENLLSEHESLEI